MNAYQGRCHCGAIRFSFSGPETIDRGLRCNCSICRRKGALWVYYATRQVRLIPATGATSIYLWGDKTIEFHSCKVCACSTHWEAVDKSHNRMGVNARMMDPAIVAAAKVKKISGP